MGAGRTAVQQLGLAPLRSLLILSRELLQSDRALGSLELIGRALAELIQSDSALLVIRGETLDIVGFDKRGVPHQAGPAHPLYQVGMDALAGVHSSSAGQAQHKKLTRRVGTHTLVMAVPANAPVAALVVHWDRELNGTELGQSRLALSPILELATAALGKIEARNLMERVVWSQRAELASTTEAHAVELARRDEVETEMRVLALTDVLTGLYNRRGFFFQAEQLFKVSQRKHAKSAVIFADVDRLKRVNDELGHDAGDGLIRDAGAVFRQSFRRADVVARLGGDEFVAYTLDDEQPDAILHRIRAHLRAFNLMQERPYAVSVSAGIVQCDPDGEQKLQDYVLLADQAMYANKRNRLH
jgi:diguanylate cyclase (GGDEF)-like protein